MYRGDRKITIGSKGLFCDLESTSRVCLCTLYPKVCQTQPIQGNIMRVVAENELACPPNLRLYGEVWR